MPHKRHKGKALRATSRANTPRSSRSQRASLDAHIFSMADEIKNTERHHTAFLPQVRLRDRRIAFVSSGQHVGQTPQEVPVIPLQDQVNDLVSPLDKLFNLDICHARDHPTMLDGASDLPDFVVDTVGDRSVIPNTNPPQSKRPASPTPSDSDSSSEVILFQGRSRPLILQDPLSAPTAVFTHVKQPPVRPADPVTPVEPHITDALLNVLGAALEQQNVTINEEEPQSDLGWASVRPRYTQETRANWMHYDGTMGIPDGTHIQDLWETDRTEPRTFHKSNKDPRISARKQRAADEHAALLDYIENMSDKDNIAMPKTRLTLDTSGWSSAAEQDNEDDTEIDDVEIDDASIDSQDLSALNQSGDDTDLEATLDRRERERYEDDEDLRIRHRDAMTDEQLAHILAKQESFGIDADDLYLIDDSGFGDVEEARRGLATLAESSKVRHGRGASAKGLSTNAGDDPYGKFDIMDFDRPSLRRKKSGRKSAGTHPANLDDLSDDELIATLQESWTADRRKKSLKKAEREELRAAGLLGGGKSGRADLSRQYDEGMNLSEIRDVVQDFLLGKEDSKAFPPMSHEARKELHTIANRFSLTSKSRGNGNDRFVVFAKTKRTLRWSEQRWSQASCAVARSFLPNSKAKGGGSTKKSAGGRSAGGAGSGTCYRHGEVVGASAPEISAENFGRKLMEKMGWSHGMALGKPGESSESRLLVPVQATIKTGRGGLG